MGENWKKVADKKGKDEIFYLQSIPYYILLNSKFYSEYENLQLEM